jgi:hypothetical protein
MHIEKQRKTGWSQTGSIEPNWGAPFEAQGKAVLRPYKIAPSNIARRPHRDFAANKSRPIFA